MSTYNTNCTPCSTTQTVVTPCDGCAMILSDTCVVRKTDAIACLGIAVDDTLHTMIDKIAAKICAIDGNNFDTTCLSESGVINDTANNAINLLITAVCDAVVTFPTFNTSCLSGGGVGDTLASTINRLISAACATPAELTFALNWTCLSSPVSTTLTNVLQGLVNNIKANQLSFGSGFTVTPLTSGCGSIVTYAGPGSPGITLTSTNGIITTASPASSIIVTGGPTSYNIQPSFANQARVLFTGFLTTGLSTDALGTITSSYRVRWDNHVDFDGVIYVNTPIMTSVGWPVNNTIDLFTISGNQVPDRIKAYPAQLLIEPSSSWAGEFPANYCTMFDATIYVTPGLNRVSIKISDCKDIVAMIEAVEAISGFPGLKGTIWLSQVQYYTV
jgi:hypothetical protein